MEIFDVPARLKLRDFKILEILIRVIRDRYKQNGVAGREDFVSEEL